MKKSKKNPFKYLGQIEAADKLLTMINSSINNPRKSPVTSATSDYEITKLLLEFWVAAYHEGRADCALNHTDEY